MRGVASGVLVIAVFSPAAGTAVLRTDWCQDCKQSIKLAEKGRTRGEAHGKQHRREAGEEGDVQACHSFSQAGAHKEQRENEAAAEARQH